MNWASLGLVALGGAIGSVLRAIAAWAIPASRLPWGTIAVNIAGSLLIGWVIGRTTDPTGADMRRYSFWAIGVCGGFTTFSSFSWQTFAQLQKGDWGLAAVNVVLSVVCCVAATWVGWRLAR
jgi:CrcB protein